MPSSFTPQPVRQLLQARTEVKVDKGPHLAYVNIIATKNGGIVREKNQDPWESELLLVATLRGAESLLDVSIDLEQLRARFKLDAPKIEPGLCKFNIVRLPAMAEARPLGQISMATYWLDVSPSFDLYDDAREAFENA